MNDCFSHPSRGEAQQDRRRFKLRDAGFSLYVEWPVILSLRDSPLTKPLALTE